MNRTSLLAAGAAATLGLGALAGCGSNDDAPAKTPAKAASGGAAADGATPVAVKLTEWAVEPSKRTVGHGPITFDVTNDGKAPHELVVLRTSKPASDLGSGTRISETGHVGEQGDLPAGASKQLKLTLAPGHYSLVCNLPGHYMAGMHADLTVR
jgi:uncharacterized cupredoxin-like copper-binding protein